MSRSGTKQSLINQMLLSLIVFLGFSRFTTAGAEFSSEVWQTEHGLPHNSVQVVTQSRDGYLWIGTKEGLARFDGVRFTTFDDIPELKGRPITALMESKDRSLWVGIENGGLIRLREKEFAHFSKADGLANENVRAIFEASDNSIWVGTTEGLFCYRQGKFIRYTEAVGLPNNVVRSICEGPDGTLWIGTGNGLAGFKDEVFTTYRAQDGMINTSLRIIFPDSRGSLWIGTAALSHLKDGQFTHYARNNGLTDSNVTAIYEDRNNKLLVGTFGGLFQMHADGSFSPITAQETSFDTVNCIIEDHEGNLWVGTKDGLYRLNARLFTSFTKNQGLSHNSAVSIYENSKEELWIGTWGGGLNRIVSGKFMSYFPSQSMTGTVITTNTPSSDFILAIHETRDGSLWIGTDYDGGLFQFTDGEFRHYGKSAGLGDNSIRVIHEDRAGNLWIGTGSALNCFTNGQFVRYTTENGLPGNIITVIAEAADGTLWVGTTEGLARLKGGLFTAFTTAEGLSNKRILSLRESADGTLWIGTGGGGLNHFKNGTFVACTTSHGLFSDVVYEIVEDEHGYFWMSSNRGIFKVSKNELNDFAAGKLQTIRSFSYGKADGLASLQCIGVAKPAGWKAKNGQIWFPTTKGIVMAKPELAQPNQILPPVIIEEIIADKVAIRSSKLRSQPARMDAPSTSNLEQETLNLVISPGHAQLEFHYTALSFRQPEKNRFKYKLEGVDAAWVDAGSRRVAYYNNISPGSYRFRVIGCNNDGFWNETGALVNIKVLPHFWQTWWFISCAGVAAFGLVGSSVRYATRKRMERNLQILQQQHAIEKERARIAKDIHDDLGSSLTRITMLGERANEELENPGELKTHINKMVGFARDTVRSLDEIVWAVNPENDALESLADYISHYADEFFENTNVRCRLEMPIDLPKGQLSAEIRHNLFLVVKEALNNALKYAGASDVCIRMSEQNSTLSIVVEDNGCGFTASEKLNEKRGNGLRNMRKRMEGVGGQFSVQSAPGKGTQIKLSISIHFKK